MTLHNYYNKQKDQEFNLNEYYLGCNSRISYSSLISADTIKYWLNVQNNKIAQRKLIVSGTASNGVYNIDYGNNDVIGGGVGINSVSKDNIIYAKIISNSNLDYSVTSCNISGWVIDYFFRINDLSKDYILITGGSSGSNAYNDDIVSFAGEYSSTANQVIWETSFSAKTIKELHVYYYYHLFSNAGNTKIFLDMNVNGSWINIAYHEQIGAGTKSGTESLHDYTTRNIVTGIRYRTENHNIFHIAKLKLYDISTFI